VTVRCRIKLLFADRREPGTWYLISRFNKLALLHYSTLRYFSLNANILSLACCAARWWVLTWWTMSQSQCWHFSLMVVFTYFVLCMTLTSPCPADPLQVVGFDMVDDESKPERRPTKHSPLPQVTTTFHQSSSQGICS
jgi:hypothetical protein